MDGVVVSPILTTKERLCLLDIIEALGSVNTSDQFLACISGEVQGLLPHEKFVGSIVDGGDGSARSCLILQHGFPGQYFQKIWQSDGAIQNSLVRYWRATREPIFVNLQAEADQIRVVESASAGTGRCMSAAAHGMFDIQGAVSSFFAFIDFAEKPGARHIYLLKFLVPHLHVALVRTFAGDIEVSDPSGTYAGLSEKQVEIIRWIYGGKSNKEIAAGLQLSVGTVKYHIVHIFSALGVSNRAQAVAKALSLKILK